MKSVGIREANARLSELARAAADGEPTLLTNYGKPLAVLAPFVESQDSDPAEFRKTLLAMPHPLDFDF